MSVLCGACHLQGNKLPTVNSIGTPKGLLLFPLISLKKKINKLFMMSLMETKSELFITLLWVGIFNILPIKLKSGSCAVIWESDSGLRLLVNDELTNHRSVFGGLPFPGTRKDIATTPKFRRRRLREGKELA